MEKFSPATGGPISSAEAQKQINEFRAKYPDLTRSTSIGRDRVLAWAKFFEENPDYTGLVAFNTLEDGAVKPVYYARTNEGKLGSFYAGTAKGTDGDGDMEGDNFTQQCPPYCPDDPED